MYETRLGLAKHRTPFDSSKQQVFSELNCSLEGQVADLADRIAYNCHDLEDAMRAGVINFEQLKDVPIFAEAQNRINANAIIDPTSRRIRTAKAIIDILVSDCIETSRKTIARANIKTLENVYSTDKNLIAISTQSDDKIVELEKFLLENFYLHDSVTRSAGKVKDGFAELFERFCRNQQLMPEYFQHLMPKHTLQRTVCDYIAGMTDRFCLKMVDKL